MENTDTGVSHTSLTENDLYDGNLSSVPSSTAGLMKLSVAHLRAILRAHSVSEIGTKEELLARVGLLKAGYPEAAISRERLCILHMVAVAEQIAEIQEDRLQPRTKLLRHFNAIFNFAPCNLRVQKEQIRPPPHPWCNVVLA